MKKLLVLTVVLLPVVGYMACGSAVAAEVQGEETLMTNVQREGDKVWIEGVKGWDFSQKTSSVHAAMETVMRTVGEDVDYSYLLGVSGLAFRMQVHKGWCPSSAHPSCGYECVRGSVAALPWKIRAYQVKPEDTEGVKRAREAVVASIDRGVPCAYGSKEDGVIIGYQKGGEEWVCVHPFRGGRTFVETEWPWGIGVYSERKDEQPDRRKLAIDSLKQAVKMAHTKNVEDYACGFNAWEQWIAHLRDEKWVESGLKDRAPLMLGNSWIYSSLVEYRAAAATHLPSVAPDFGDEIAAHLSKAADLYERMVTEMLIKDKCALEIAPSPWDLKAGQQWTQAMRNEQAGILAAEFALEKQAIAEIEEALALIEK